MANILYPKGKEHLLNGDIDLLVDTVKVCLVDTGVYTYNAADEYLSSIDSIGSPPADARVGTDQTLTGKSTTNGVFDAGDPTFPAVSGATVENLVIYVEVGSPPTQYLLARIDTATGLPATPSGGDIVVNWDNGANKIFAL